jgi:hypothetical protein
MDESSLRQLYIDEAKSMHDIAVHFECSLHKVDYWLRKYSIPKRSHSDATYVKHNGLVDPFTIKKHLTPTEQRLYGLGIGIYWGEGNKRNIHSVRVGNTDPQLLKTFISFLVQICGVDNDRIRYGLQLFSDVDESVALSFWQRELSISRNQIMPTVNRIESGKIGTYRTKNMFGVMTVYVFNKKLRDWCVEQLIMPR